jgi:branched-chain amino acid transport system ATP-binding protein
MLEVRALRGGYGRMEVLRGLSMDVKEGEIVALVGSNGAGKTTLNNTLSGLLPAFSGTITFEDRAIAGARYTAIVAAGLIHVPEGRRVFPNLSVQENLVLGSYRRGRARRARNLERVFAVFPKLKERLAQRAGTLSGGEQQMLAIGRGLMAEPRLLVLDEPSLGLSPVLVEELFALIARLNREGLSILLVEQNVGQSLEIAHRAYVLENGQGTPSELLAKSELKSAYLGL